MYNISLFDKFKIAPLKYLINDIDNILLFIHQLYNNEQNTCLLQQLVTITNLIEV